MPARVGLKLPAVRLPALELPVPSKWMQEQTARPAVDGSAPPVAAAEPDGGASRYPAPVISTAQFDTPTEEPRRQEFRRYGRSSGDTVKFAEPGIPLTTKQPRT